MFGPAEGTGERPGASIRDKPQPPEAPEGGNPPKEGPPKRGPGAPGAPPPVDRRRRAAGTGYRPNGVGREPKEPYLER